jgi:hypothetical protein
MSQLRDIRNDTKGPEIIVLADTFQGCAKGAVTSAHLLEWSPWQRWRELISQALSNRLDAMERSPTGSPW